MAMNTPPGHPLQQVPVAPVVEVMAVWVPTPLLRMAVMRLGMAAVAVAAVLSAALVVQVLPA